jgi:hypothetical protein
MRSSYPPCLDPPFRPLPPLVNGLDYATDPGELALYENITEMKISYYGFSFRLITGITGPFFKILLIWTNPPPKKKALEPSYFEKYIWKITDIMEITIMEYYGILRSVISPPRRRGMGHIPQEKNQSHSSAR